MTRELLQQVRILDPVSAIDRVADVLIADGIVQTIADDGSESSEDTIVRDCRGLILGAGLVDLYSYSGEPGFEERETLESLLQAAIAGGFTRLAILPATVPALDNPASIAWVQERQASIRAKQAVNAATKSSPNLRCWAAVTLGLEGQQLTELAELAQSPIAGFADGQPLTNLLLVRRLLEYVQPLGKPVALWTCDRSLVGNGVMREGQESVRFGLPGIPAIAETAALSALLECVAAIGTPVHFMRISTARSVEIIQAGKARGLPITASTSWMHLLLNSDALRSYDPNVRLNPPLGNPTDQAALIEGVKAGVIDAIAIDHTPHTYEEKTVAFAEAPPGAIGLELALPLLWQALVATQKWSALELWRCLSMNPAACLQQSPPSIAVGQPLEAVLFDPSEPWIVDGRSLISRSHNTPWLGKELVGRVVDVWCA